MFLDQYRTAGTLHYTTWSLIIRKPDLTGLDSHKQEQAKQYSKNKQDYIRFHNLQLSSKNTIAFLVFHQMLHGIL